MKLEKYIKQVMRLCAKWHSWGLKGLDQVFFNDNYKS